MEADRLRLLLRLRAEALAPPAAAIDRALARCARLGTRSAAASGRRASSSSATAMTAVPTVPPAPASGATVLSRADAGDGTGATVQSLASAPASAPGQLEAGRIVAGYRIEGLLGKGGMGAVYRATQLSMNRPVAFKVLAPRFAHDPAFVGRFKREARAAGRLHHHNVVMVHDAGEADGLVFFSMELVEGRSLRELIRERGRFPPDEALRIVRQVLEALAYAHGRSVVHRDIKPDNIMLTPAGVAKVADLGLSRIDGPASADTTELFQTAVGSFMGTPHYMAPEQGRDAHGADHRADLWSVGATLYHMTTGAQPFTGGTPMEVLIAAQTRPLAWADPAPSAHLRAVVERLMAKDPAARPADAAEAIRLIEGGAAKAAAPARRRRGWGRILWPAAGLAALAVVAVLVLGALRDQREQARERDWQVVVAAARREAEVHAYPAALETLQRARAAMPDGSARARAAEAEIAVVTDAWNAWARPQLDELEAAVRRLLAAGDLVRARERLEAAPEAWRSPETVQRLAELSKTWDEAFKGFMERQRDADSEPVRQLEAMRDQRRKLANELWRRGRFEPEGSVRLDEGVAVFSGSGSGSVPLPGLGNIALRIVPPAQMPAASRWELTIGPGHRILITPDGAFVEDRRGSVRLPAVDGAVTVPVPRKGFMPGAGAGGRPLTIEARTVWQLGSAEVQVGLVSLAR
jgi:hypothetical protein